MHTGKSEIGKFGEETAGKYLAGKGYGILEKNFRTRWGELDLICQDGKITVFVEVKTKTGRMAGSGEEMFNLRKYQRVLRMAQIYLRGREVLCRIDMVAVELDTNGQVKDIRHYKNAGGELNYLDTH